MFCIHPLHSDRPIRTMVFSFDENYAKYFSVVTASLSEHYRHDCVYDLVVFHNGIGEETQKRLEAQLEEGFTIRFFDVTECFAECFGDAAHAVVEGKWSEPVFYDLLIPILMPKYERVVFCDVDVLFLEDPGELFAMPFDGKAVIAVEDSFGSAFRILPDNAFLKRQARFVRETAKIEDTTTYFNSGLLVFNLSNIDREDYLQLTKTAFQAKELPTVDQDVLNYVFKGNVRYAPIRFNLQVGFLPTLRKAPQDDHVSKERARYETAAAAPVMVHFTTEKKPWAYVLTDFSEAYWNIAERSPFRREIVEENRSMLKKTNPYRLWKTVLSWILRGITFGKSRTRFKEAFVKQKRSYALGKKIGLFWMICMMLFLSACGQGSVSDGYGDSGKLSASLPAAESVEEAEVYFTERSGVFEDKRLKVTLAVPEGYFVAYTLDGTTPSAANSTGFSEVEVMLTDHSNTEYLIQNRDRMVYPEIERSFLLKDASLPTGIVLRAAAVSETGEAGPAFTEVYFLNVDFETRFPGCLVISLVTDPDNLLNYETGILTPGAIYDEWKTSEAAAGILERGEYWEIQSNITQHGKDWERPCFLQFFEGNRAPAIGVDAGMRITGNVSRIENQKSFNFYFRKSYGTKELEYELFEGIPQYNGFRLRAGGNNTNWIKFKDAFLMELVRDRAFTMMETRPAVLFINGEYWGPYLLSEKMSAETLRDHYGVDKDQIILMKEGELEEGEDEDIQLYEELMSYADKDLTDPAIWEEFTRIMDVQSMADYCATRIYFGDADWRADKNDVLWRTRDDSYNGGRWQYLLYDVEFSSNMYGPQDERTAASTNHFQIAKEAYPLFGAAMRNEEFKAMFLAALKEIGSVNCESGRVSELLETYVNEWKPLMPDYYKRFGDYENLWDLEIGWVREFFETRYDLLIPMVEGSE